MKLTITRDEYDALEPDVKSRYVAIENGARYRHVELVEQITRTDEFRDTNRRLSGQVTALQTRVDALTELTRVVGDRTPEQVQAMFERLAALEATGVSRPDDVATRIEQALNPLRLQVTTLTTQITQKETQLQARELDARLVEAARNGGVEDSMVEDFVSAARTGGAKLHNGAVVFVDASGVQKTATDGSLMTLASFIADLRERKPRYFRASEGMDAVGRPIFGAPGAVVRRIKRAEAGNYLKELAAGTVVYED